MSTPPGTSSDALSIPDHRLERVIGRGSYGEVWLARSTLGTPRAIKIVRRDSFDTERPFLREFTGIQRFEPISRSHDGLVDILHVGRAPDGSAFYYVMELADPRPGGEAGGSRDGDYEPRTLASDLERARPLALTEALPVFLNLAGAVNHLHAHGLLHHDIKPANVIFVNGVAKLADIGLVAATGESDTYVGTEGFVPPEGPGSESADLYALGKLMYEAVTGFDRTRFPTLPLLRGHPSANRALLEFNAVLLRCCDPRPDQRYRGAAELLADLALLQSGQSVRQFHRIAARLRFARRAGALTGLILLLASAGWWASQRSFQRAEALRRRAEQAEGLANDRLYDALVARASAERRSGGAGARQASLEALRQAAAFRKSELELRKEAITALALPEFSELARWPASGPSVNPHAISPDGTLRASALGPDGTIEIHGIDPDLVRSRLPDPAGPPQWVGPFSPDGSRLLVVRADGTARVWDVSNARILRDWPPAAESFARAFVDGNQAVIEPAPSRGVQRHDLTSGQSRFIPAGLDATFVAPSPDGKAFALASSRTNRIEIHPSDGGGPPRILHLSGSATVWSLAWSPDASRMVASGSDYQLRVWSLAGDSKEPEIVFRGHAAEVNALAWQPQRDSIVSSSWDGTTRLWGLIERRELARIMDGGWGLQPIPTSDRLARIDGRNRDLVLYRANIHPICRPLPLGGALETKTSGTSQFSIDGRWLFAPGEKELLVFRVADGLPMARWPTPRRPWPFPWPVDGELLLFESGACRILHYSAPDAGGFDFTGEEVLSGDQLAERAAPRGLHEPLVQWEDGKIQVRSATRPTRSFQLNSPFRAYALSPDGTWLAVSGEGWVRIWNLTDSSGEWMIPGARHYGVRFHPREPRVFVPTPLGIRAIDLPTRRVLWDRQLVDQEAPSALVAITADGRQLATCLTRYSFLLLDSRTGAVLARVEHPDPQSIVGLRFSPDGRRIAATCESRQVQLWDLARLRSELRAVNLDWSDDDSTIPAPPAP